MNDGARKHIPYKPLGVQLKRLREKLQETVAEVSGAVEIDPQVLDRIEHGKARPSEDILELLINHFEVHDEEANRLWELAGYDKEETEGLTSVVVMPMDARIAYTDMLNVIVNDYGVTLQFLQTAGPNNQPLVVSRLGMSHEHARSVIELLQKTLAQSGRKALPPTTDQ